MLPNLSALSADSSGNLVGCHSHAGSRSRLERVAAPVTVVVPAGIVPRILVTILAGVPARRLEPGTIVAPVTLLLRPTAPTGLVLQSLSIAGVQHVI